MYDICLLIVAMSSWIYQNVVLHKSFCLLFFSNPAFAVRKVRTVHVGPVSAYLGVLSNSLVRLWSANLVSHQPIMVNLADLPLWSLHERLLSLPLWLKWSSHFFLEWHVKHGSSSFYASIDIWPLYNTAQRWILHKERLWSANLIDYWVSTNQQWLT